MTTPPFPNTPAPAWFRTFVWNTAPSKRNGVHYVGDTVTLTLNSSLSDTVTYTVRNYFGTILSTGSVSSGNTSFTPTAPSGGWKPGWYRVYLTGPQTDTNFFNSYGVTNFCVIRNDSHFVPMPAGNTTGADQVSLDLVMKGVMGVGTSRLSISRAYDPTFDPGNGQNLVHATADLARTNTYWVDPGAPYADAARPRYAWVDFPGGAYDSVEVASGRYFMCKDETLDGSQIFVEIVNGTNPSTLKVNVYSPNATTLVETFDNLNPATVNTTWQPAINGVSNYVVFHWFNDVAVTTFTKAAIGHDYFDGVVDVVSTLYPLGCTHYEGPRNEPDPSTQDREIVAHITRLFAGAVHAGHPDAQAIGPSYVAISWADTRGWYGFFNAGGHTYLDGISFHAYNAQDNGDINLGRTSFDTFVALMNQFGVDLPLWQTESTHAFTSVYGIYHPRRARVYLLQTLLEEKYGVPKEQNNAWYDTSHGFWNYPAWLENEDGSLNPQVILYRVLAEEIWGKTYSGALDFGTPGNNMFLANIYSGAAGSTVVLMPACYMDGASITLSVTGTTSVTVVDGWGVSSSVPLSQGRVQVPMTDVPAYVELPVGAQAGVYQINDWPPLAGIGGSFSSSGTTKDIDGVSYPVIANDAFMTSYGSGVGIAPTTFATPPSVTRVLFPTSKTVERVIVWCGPSWQASGTLLTFDVQTTLDGTNWTTRRTITKPTPFYFEFGSNSVNGGCFLETYWDEQWIFDVKLPNPATCTGVRLNVTKASFGGEPLSDTTYGTSFGQGTDVEAYRIQEIGIYGFVSAGGGGRPPIHLGKGSAW